MNSNDYFASLLGDKPGASSPSRTTVVTPNTIAKVRQEQAADAFAADKFRFAKWGTHKIAAALRRKRIPSGIIAAALDKAIDPQREKQTAYDEMAKKLRGIKSDEPKQKLWQKLMRFGIARGYSVEVCKEAISRLLADK
jgi:SOS response regulatory protein OraA/RecX